MAMASKEAVKTPFETIPRELLRSIFLHLEAHELYIVIQTCKSFAAAGKAVLCDHVDLALLVSIFDEYPELLKEFFKDNSKRSQKQMIGRKSYLLSQPENYDDAYSKGYHLFQLWTYLSRCPDGKLVSDLSVAVHDAGGYRPNLDKSTEASMVAKLLGNCSTEKLTRLSIRLNWLSGARRFKNLRTFKLAILPAHFNLQPLKDDVRLLHLERLEILWKRPSGPRVGDMMTGFEANRFLEIDCWLLCCFTTARSIEINATDVIDLNVNELVPIRRQFIKSLTNVYLELRYPRLIDFTMVVSQPTSYHNILIPVPPATPFKGTFYDVFARFVNRHTTQLKKFRWIGSIGPPTEEQQDVQPFMPFPVLERFQVSLHQSLMAQDFRDLDWCENLTSKCQDSMQDLLLSGRYNGDEQLLKWIPTFIGRFSNLVKLRIEGIRFMPDELVEMMGTKNYLVASMGVTTEQQLIDYLPPTLQDLTVELADLSKTFSISFAQVKLRTKALFEGRTNLNSVTFIHASVPGAYTRTQRLIFRRRPMDWQAPDPQLKKVCMWNVDFTHGPDDEPGEIGHFILVGYAEHLLKKGEYRGPDGDKWMLDRSQMMMLRSCEVNGVGGCDHYAMRKGFWLPRPFEG